MSEYGWLLELEHAPETHTAAFKKNEHRFQDEHVLLIDHHDSFTQIIKSYFEQLGVSVTIVQHQDTALHHLDTFKPTCLVLSPGPGSPGEAYATQVLIQKYRMHYPMLGICLGHQCLVEALGGRVITASEIWHGKQAVIHHHGDGLFSGLPSTFLATRYHSLVVDEHDLSNDWRITAWTHDANGRRVIMGVAHQSYPLFGVQYHPEAVLTEHGMQVLRNFLINNSHAQAFVETQSHHVR